MSKTIFFYALWLVSNTNYSADLISVFHHALENDSVYQQAIQQASLHHEEVAISKAYLLPRAQLNTQPLISGQNNSGAIVPMIQPPQNTLRSNQINLSLTQPIFNVALFSRYKTAKITARAAVAHLNSELQDLMVRVTQAYFQVLRGEKTVVYLKANKKALKRQLHDVEQQLIAGKTTESYQYIAQSSYNLAQSDLLSAENTLEIDKEHLNELTAVDETQLADLNKKIPLASPKPQNQSRWLQKALRNNWTIKEKQLRVHAAREVIKQKYADHLPRINAKLIYGNHGFNYTQSSTIIAAGSSRMQNSAAVLDVKIPIFSGGLVVAATRKAQRHFKIAQQQLEQNIRKTSSDVRTSYRNVLVNIKKIKYQSAAIYAAERSLDGLRERYNSGSGNLVDVLNQQASLLKAQMDYEYARYDYVLSIIVLKKAAGILSMHDLIAINQWLSSADSYK